MLNHKYPVVLSIAGSDSGGGAGIQADLKTMSALGCFGTTAITAITVQNTLGVTGIHPVPVDFVIGQIRAVMDDLKPSAIKIGMVHSTALVQGIADTLKHYPDVPVVVDPVMVASSGDRLIEHLTIKALKEQLFPLATLITPNLDEAMVLTGMKINNVDNMKSAAQSLLQYGSSSLLVKGGHLVGQELSDVYLHKDGDFRVLKSPKIETRNTHGTGCTLSSAIASFLALGNCLSHAIANSKQYIHSAIEHGKDVKTGEGFGAVNHFFNPEKLVRQIRVK